MWEADAWDRWERYSWGSLGWGESGWLEGSWADIEPAQEEAQAAAYAISLLGGRLRQVIPIELQGLAEVRHLVVIEKVARTPKRYPRRTGIPAKRPLRGI